MMNENQYVLKQLQCHNVYTQSHFAGGEVVCKSETLAMQAQFHHTEQAQLICTL